MKNLIFFNLVILFLVATSYSQTRREDIYSENTLFQKRAAFKKDLNERIIGKDLLLPLDSNTEYKFESACWAISQFLLTGTVIEQGFTKLFNSYDSLQIETRRAFLEAVYAVYPQKYAQNIKDIFSKENDPRLFSICAAYLYRYNGSSNNSAFLKTKLARKFPGYDTIPSITELEKWLSFHHSRSLGKTPDIIELFRYQKNIRQKIIYSFQRWNRDYSGLAIIQSADGHFVKQMNGKLMVYEQLARSGSGLPYFITNGNTPQGIFSIQGLAVTNNTLIGPTPNIQMIMPFERSWEKFFLDQGRNTEDSLEHYLQLLPASWRNYAPMMEAWDAGRIGRTEIIAHGTTIDPDFFKERPFYPMTPTLGCLCAKEIWNPTNGKLLQSEQFNLITGFDSTPGNNGYLFVINLNDEPKPVSRAELEHWVNEFEKRK